MSRSGAGLGIEGASAARGKKNTKAAAEATRRMTIAERRAAEANREENNE